MVTVGESAEGLQALKEAGSIPVLQAMLQRLGTASSPAAAEGGVPAGDQEVVLVRELLLDLQR